MSPLRIGNFTSGEIWRLTTTDKSGKKWGAQALSYIAEKVAEADTGKTVKSEFYSQPTTWGEVMERFAFAHESVSLSYSIMSKDTLPHPRYNYWVGTPDLVQEAKKVKEGEVKCYYLKKYHAFSRCLLQKDVQLFKSLFAQEYWQIVSNCCILGVPIGEAISFMPYETHLIAIRKMLMDSDFVINELGHSGEDLWKTRFIYEKPLSELPCLPDNSNFPDLVQFEFEVPEMDMLLLESCVVRAEQKKQNDLWKP